MSLVPDVKDEDYREGKTRGGRDQFSWEAVKSDTYRENYLGYSVKANVKRYGDKNDAFWWSKDKKKEKGNVIEDEKKKMKELENKMMREALVTGTILSMDNEVEDLDAIQKKEILQKNMLQRDETDGERVQGLGIGHARKHDFVDQELRMRRSEDTSPMETPTQLEATPSLSQPKAHKKHKKRSLKDKKRLLKKLKQELGR